MEIVCDRCTNGIAQKIVIVKLCSEQPVQFCRNASLIVDLHMLDVPLDILADENGVWKCKGSPVAYVSVHTNGRRTTVLRRKKMATRSNHYKVTRTYYRHASSPDFTRIITVVHGKLHKNINKAVVCM